MKPGEAQLQCYRIWIAGYDDWQPTDWHDVPPRAIALEPAEAFVLSAAQAQSFLEGFNGEMLHKKIADGQIADGQIADGQVLNAAKRLWAVAVPVMVRYEGDPHPGETVAGHRF
jgi:hypothetical protein